MMPRGAVVVPHHHPQHVEVREQFLAFEHALQGGEAALAEEHVPQADFVGAGAGVGQPHVELEEEHGGDKEVLVGPELGAVEDPDAAPVVADVDGEPDFLQGEGCGSWEEEPLVAQADENLVDDAFAVGNHTEPSETGHISDSVWDAFVAPGCRVEHAETFVAAENKGSRGFWGLCFGLSEDHGGEVGIGKAMKVWRWRKEKRDHQRGVV